MKHFRSKFERHRWGDIVVYEFRAFLLRLRQAVAVRLTSAYIEWARIGRFFAIFGGKQGF
jgi:hypothetical protein